MKIIFLGTGTSTGVPQIGCTCHTCCSNDPKDHRLRCSVLIEEGNNRILIDCGPDFREQMLTVSFEPITGVLLTHEHYDHVGGLDDLRPFCKFGSIDVWGSESCLNHVKERMPYCFERKSISSIPKLKLRTIDSASSFFIEGIEVTPINVLHGSLPIYGYRINNVVYITDMLHLESAEEMRKMKGVDLLIINALRKEPHPTHQTLDGAIHLAREVGANNTFFIHMSHQIGLHRDVEALLPEKMHLAYDGLEVSV